MLLLGRNELLQVNSREKAQQLLRHQRRQLGWKLLLLLLLQQQVCMLLLQTAANRRQEFIDLCVGQTSPAEATTETPRGDRYTRLVGAAVAAAAAAIIEKQEQQQQQQQEEQQQQVHDGEHQQRHQ